MSKTVPRKLKNLVQILYLVLLNLNPHPLSLFKSAKKMELVVAKRPRSGRLVIVPARYSS